MLAECANVASSVLQRQANQDVPQKESGTGPDSCGVKSGAAVAAFLCRPWYPPGVAPAANQAWPAAVRADAMLPPMRWA